MPITKFIGKQLERDSMWRPAADPVQLVDPKLETDKIEELD